MNACIHTAVICSHLFHGAVKPGTVHFNLCLHSGDLFTQVPGCSQWCGGSTGLERGNTLEKRSRERAHSKMEWQIGESVYVHAVDAGMHLARWVIAGDSGINLNLSGLLGSCKTMPICLVYSHIFQSDGLHNASYVLYSTKSFRNDYWNHFAPKLVFK